MKAQQNPDPYTHTYTHAEKGRLLLALTCYKNIYTANLPEMACHVTR